MRGLRCRLCERRGVQLHHIVYRQHVRRAKGDVDDAENLMRVCVECHGSHHARRTVIRVEALRDNELEWAFGLLGPAAYDYFRRYYDAAGDSRLEALLERASGSLGEVA